MKIKSIQSIPYQGTVYNFGVCDDESYTIERIKVKNCRGINVAVLKGETPLPTITGIPQSLRSKVETVEGVPRINTVTQPKEPIIRKDSRAYEKINN